MIDPLPKPQCAQHFPKCSLMLDSRRTGQTGANRSKRKDVSAPSGVQTVSFFFCERAVDLALGNSANSAPSLHFEFRIFGCRKHRKQFNPATNTFFSFHSGFIRNVCCVLPTFRIFIAFREHMPSWYEVPACTKFDKPFSVLK